MKKRIVLLGFISILLLAVSSCGQSKYDEYLNIPNLKWGMTIDEVKDFLEIKEEDMEKEEYVVQTSIVIENYKGKIFGEQPVRIFFDFVDLGDGVPRLYLGNVHYDRETVDMNTLLKRVVEEYGDTVSSVSEYGPRPTAHTNDGFTGEESDTIKLWKSVPMKELLSKEDYEAYRKSWGNIPNDPEAIDGFDDELWQNFVENTSAVTVSLYEDYDRIKIAWNGYNYGIYDQVNESFKE